jgi:pyocin large subunit-like protein
MTKAIMDQKIQCDLRYEELGFKFKQSLKDVALEQEKLRRASAIQWTNNANGKNVTDMYYAESRHRVDEGHQ